MSASPPLTWFGWLESTSILTLAPSAYAAGAASAIVRRDEHREEHPTHP